MKEHYSRIGNTIRNTTIGLLGQIVTYVLVFVYRTIFIRTMGITYLGVQGLFGNILSILSLAELGIGSAITFSLYKPLADNNQKLIKGLMNFYAKAYRVIGLTVAIAGLSLTPFLNTFIGDNSNIHNLTVIYLLYLSDSVLSYFFSYKRSIIVADQKGYINTININLFSIVRILSQSILLIEFKNFIFVLIVQIITTFISNISISRRAGKLYPYLRDKNTEKIDPDIKVDLVKKIRAMVYHQLGQVVVLGTDNILISSFVGVYWVGIYSNYTLIIGVVNTIIQQFSQSIVASVGNLVSKETINKTKTTFDLLFFVNYWIYSFSSICFLTLFNPFIRLWIGPKYLFDFWIVVIIVINFYIAGMRQNVLTFRNALGLFWYDRYKPIFESIINLIASIILLKRFGIVGVFIGTLISTVTTSFWVEPYVLFKYYFNGGLIKYFIKYLSYTMVTVFVAFVVKIFSIIIYNGTIISFILICNVCIIIPNMLFYIIFYKTKEFKIGILLGKRILKSRKLQ